MAARRARPRLPHPDAPPRSPRLAAGVGTGQWRNLDEALEVLAVERTFVPEQRAVETYDKVFARHRTLYDGLRPLFAE